MMSASTDDAPPLYAVQPRFHLRNFWRSWPLFLLLGVFLGAFGVIAFTAGQAPPWAYAVAAPLGILFVMGVTWFLRARMAFPDSWYAVHADHVLVRRGGLFRSHQKRAFVGVVEVDVRQTPSEAAAKIGTVRLWRQHKEPNGQLVRVKDELTHVPDPDEFAKLIRPLITKAQNPTRVQAPK